MALKTKYQVKPYESAGGYRNRHGPGQSALHKDVSANIYESMFRSAAFRDLSYKQQSLYLACKLQLYGKRKPGRDYPDILDLQGDDLFYLNLRTVVEEYGLYSEKTEANFYKDMDALVNHGLIDRVSSGKGRREKTIYRYSSRWITWEKPEPDG